MHFRVSLVLMESINVVFSFFSLRLIVFTLLQPASPCSLVVCVASIDPAVARLFITYINLHHLHWSYRMPGWDSRESITALRWH